MKKRKGLNNHNCVSFIASPQLDQKTTISKYPEHNNCFLLFRRYASDSEAAVHLKFLSARTSSGPTSPEWVQEDAFSQPPDFGVCRGKVFILNKKNFVCFIKGLVFFPAWDLSHVTSLFWQGLEDFRDAVDLERSICMPALSDRCLGRGQEKSCP